MKKNELGCSDCKHFNGYDGINELYTYCNYGDFKGSRTEKDCEKFEKMYPKMSVDVILKGFQRWFNNLNRTSVCMDQEFEIDDDTVEEYLKRW